MRLQRPLFLWGFMGAGKSSHGRELARAWGVPLYETDQLIVESCGLSIAEIFAAKREEGFRVEEQRILHALDLSRPAIVATGGGTPCFADNAHWMREHGVTVYISLPVNSLVERILHSRITRPLLPEKERGALQEHVATLLAEREKIYRQAHIAVDGHILSTVYLENILSALPL